MSTVSDPQGALEFILQIIQGGDEKRIYSAICDGSFDAYIPGLRKLSGCAHGLHIHLEGDAAAHTAKVVSSILKFAGEDRQASFDEIDLLAALIHDIEKGSTRTVAADGSISFPHHEAKAAERVPEIGAALGLSATQVDKLKFLVGEHGVVHSLPSLPVNEQKRLVTSPYWRNLRLLQKADAQSCYISQDGSVHLAVHWESFERLRREGQS